MNYNYYLVDIFVLFDYEILNVNFEIDCDFYYVTFFCNIIFFNDKYINIYVGNIILYCKEFFVY